MASTLRMIGIVVGCVVGLAGPASAQTGDRLTDKDVKTLIESVDQARDRFEDQLEGKVKNAVVRTASGEVQVRPALEDFQKEVENLKARFTGEYAASSEVAIVLRRGNAIDRLMKSQPTGTKGSSEWDRLARELGTLAAVYRTTFPLPEGAAVRRINDKEASAMAAEVGVRADEIERAVKADKTLDKPAKKALLEEVEKIAKQAKTLTDRLNDQKPATADARALREAVAALSVSGRQLPPSVLTPIGSMRAPLSTLEQAFGLVPPTQ
jgi:hypothetical protein